MIRRRSPPASISTRRCATSWIEFWYQPKIDLRRKQLVGVEAFARARHPQNGVLMPSAFMPGATESSLITLSEQALAQGLKANLNFAKLGVNLRLAVNIPVNALVKIAGGRHRADLSAAVREVAGPDHRPRGRADRHRPRAGRPTSQKVFSRSTSISRSTISAAAIPHWPGSRRCRLPNSSSTAPSSPIAAPTRSMRRCARPSSISRTISAASRSGSASRRRPTRSPWSAWAAITARDFCSVSRCPKIVSCRCCASAPPRRAGSSPPSVPPTTRAEEKQPA